VYNFLVACCSVEIKGNDGQTHILTMDAKSAHDAVRQAILAFSKLWWWTLDAIATVRRNDECWRVSVKKVIADGRS
jgi:hypothetical protein